MFCMFLRVSVNAETLKCEIEKVWAIDSAREEAFKDLKPVLDLSWALPIDPNLIENKQAMNKHQDNVENRVITTFSNGGYGVTIFDDDNYNKTYYYWSTGELIAVEFRRYPIYAKDVQDFLDLYHQGKMLPWKEYKHSYPDGKIMNITLTAKKESFIFEHSGALQFHWVGDTCYDAQGKVILTRKN